MRHAVVLWYKIEAGLGFLQRLQGSLLLSPVLLTAMLCIGLYSYGQISEILIFITEPANQSCGTHLIAGFAAVALLSTILFYGYLSACVILRKAGIGYGSSLFYTSQAELRQDQILMWMRNGLALLCAMGPLATMGFVFWRASSLIFLRDGSAPASTRIFPRALCIADPAVLAPHLQELGWLWLAAGAAFLFCLYLLSCTSLVRPPRRYIPRPRLRSVRTQLHWILKVFAALVILLPLPLMELAPKWHDVVYAWLGPLAAVGFALMAGAWLTFIMGEKSMKWGLPLFIILILFVFGYGLFLWVQRGSVQAAIETAPPATPDPNVLKSQFDGWLRARAVPGERSPVPVYIIAAPGGGIYAASNLTTVLTRLEVECPGFLQHVFAISAVSGGAIGSTLITASTRRPIERGGSGCGTAEPVSERRWQKVKLVLSTDHLSPMVGTTIPDVAWNLLKIAWYEAQTIAANFMDVRPTPPDMGGGRAGALERSFSASYYRHTGGSLDEPFEKHFSPALNAAPALVLNTTWAETGDRVAFAPFILNEVGDETLKAMVDLPKLRQVDAAIAPAKKPSLIEAAVASARYPGILPARIEIADKTAIWWNFVDGGYADSSGTTTAMELYKALVRLRTERPADGPAPYVVKLLVITEDAETGRSTNLPTGAGLVHAISPITTVLTIREQIGRRATERVFKELRAWEPKSAGACWDVARMVINQKKLNLPLGWLLAQRTVDDIDRVFTRDNAQLIDALKRNHADARDCKEAIGSSTLAADEPTKGN